MRNAKVISAVGLLFLLAVFLFPVDGKEKIYYKKGDLLFVLSEAGLVLRSSADKNASKISLAPYGKQVTVKEENVGDKPFELNGIKGYWVKVFYEGEEGYAFDGFLSLHPVPDKCIKECDDFKILELYADKKFKLKGKEKKTEDNMYFYSVKEYTNRFTIERKEGKPGLPEFSIIFTMQDVRLAEAFVMMKMMGFNNLKGRKFPVANSSGSIQMLNTKWNDTVEVKEIKGDIVYLKIYDESVDEMGMGTETMIIEFSVTEKGLVIRFSSGGS